MNRLGKLLTIVLYAHLANGAISQTTASLEVPAAATTATATLTSAPVRLTYDQIAPDQDATSETLDVASALSSDTERMEWLASAAVDEDFRETTDAKFTNYPGLTPGNIGDEPGKKADYVSTLETYKGQVAVRARGPLSGRVIFASAGHGWTNDNTSTSLWYTQRPATFNVVEDMGNLDQMNLYADVCFRAGATVVPLRPLGFQHVERIIDNNSEHAAFHGEWADSQSTASFGFAGDGVPYRFAKASTRESAVARFRPVIPVTDIYPVYTWGRAGADRVEQTYRVVHGGGVTEVDVDHRLVGNGWVYLGSYAFKAGTTGYVEVTNLVRTGEVTGVVIADAIRFGNGMGDVNRGGGISGYPREEEASRYWIERSLAEGYPPLYEAFTDREDQSNNVGAAPRFAAHMNRERAGDYFSRVFLSFHSNATGGRGVMGLFNSHAQMRPDHQIELAKLVADELNAQMTSSGLQLDEPWFVRKVRTDAHINFGEIRRDYLNNEMSATILEVAFHDDAHDAALLRKLSIRKGLAQSAYRATLRYLADVGGEPVPVISPPEPPKMVYARQGETSHTVELAWQAATEDPLSSASDGMRYRVYRSTDGVVFDTGKDVGSVTQYQVAKIREHEPVYFRVTAISNGGESLPSAVMGVSRTAGPRVLAVHGATEILDETALLKTEPGNLGRATGQGGEFVRLVPRIMNNGEQARVVGDGADRLNMGFDTISLEAFLSRGAIQGKYQAVCLMMGRSPVAEELASSATLTSLRDYVSSGGRLLLSGACLAECDSESTDVLERWGQFASTVLQTKFSPATSATRLIKSGDNNLTTITLQLGNRALRYFNPRTNEVLAPEENGRSVLAYENLGGIAGVVTLKDRLIRTALFGFPLEELDSREEQGTLMGQVLLAMGLEVQPIAPPVTMAQDATTTQTGADEKVTTSPPGSLEQADTTTTPTSVSSAVVSNSQGTPADAPTTRSRVVIEDVQSTTPR